MNSRRRSGDVDTSRPNVVDNMIGKHLQVVKLLLYLFFVTIEWEFGTRRFSSAKTGVMKLLCVCVGRILTLHLALLATYRNVRHGQTN